MIALCIGFGDRGTRGHDETAESRNGQFGEGSLL